MATTARVFGGVALLALCVGGCPMTDDYFIDAGQAKSAGSDPGGSSSGAQSSGGNLIEQGGGSGSPAAGGSGGSGAVAGAVDVPVGGVPELGQAGAGGATCVPTTERCNGHDDNCDDVADELACNSAMYGTTGCSGFVLASRPEHGYMLCTTNRKDWTHARDACIAQDMRLAWLDDPDENDELSQKVDALSNETEVLFGATDAATEGEWLWFGGDQFWQGNQYGDPVDGLYNNWAEGTPNNDNYNEDCAVLNPTTGFWGDRNCMATYAYVCEEPD